MDKKQYNVTAQVRSALRRLWLWSPMRSEAMSNARLSRGLYKCFQCQKQIGRKELAVDHTTPVTPIKGFDTWDAFINRLFCPASKLKVMCKSCHSIKTKSENLQRKKLSSGPK